MKEGYTGLFVSVALLAITGALFVECGQDSQQANEPPRSITIPAGRAEAPLSPPAPAPAPEAISAPKRAARSRAAAPIPPWRITTEERFSEWSGGVLDSSRYVWLEINVPEGMRRESQIVWSDGITRSFLYAGAGSVWVFTKPRCDGRLPSITIRAFEADELRLANDRALWSLVIPEQPHSEPRC